MWCSRRCRTSEARSEDVSGVRSHRCARWRVVGLPSVHQALPGRLPLVGYDVTNLHHNLDGIVPMARPYFDALLEQAEAWGMQPVIGDALRTCEDQAVAGTVARSWHVFGRAVDLQLRGADAYRRLGEWWEQQGGTWGGRWVDSYPPDGDFQHFQWSDGQDGIPQAIWPSGEPCDTARDRYLASDAAQTPPAAPVSRSRGSARALGYALVGGALGALLFVVVRAVRHA